MPDANLFNFVVGMAIGMSMSIPFGAVGIICVKRILSRGALAAITSGVGVALGDSIFAGVIVFGASQAVDFLNNYHRAIEFIGGSFIFAVGVWGWLQQNIQPAPEVGVNLQPRTKKYGYLLRDISTMLIMTMANPQTIIGFSAAFAAMVRFYSLNSSADSILLVMGVFAGGISWWIALGVLIDKMRYRISDKILQMLHNRASQILTVIGLLIMLHAIFFQTTIAG